MQSKFVFLLGAVVLMAVTFTEVKGDTKAMAGSVDAEEKEADETVKTLVGKLGPSIKSKIQDTSSSCSNSNNDSSNDTTQKSQCINPSKFEAVSFKKQYVSGTNYFVKVRALDETENLLGIYHVKIYEQSWTNTLEVSGIVGPMDEQAPVKYI